MMWKKAPGNLFSCSRRPERRMHGMMGLMLIGRRRAGNRAVTVLVPRLHNNGIGIQNYGTLEIRSVQRR